MREDAVLAEASRLRLAVELPVVCLAYVGLPFLGVPPTYPSVGTMSAIGGSDSS